MNGNEYVQDVNKENLERERIATTKSSQFKNLQYSYCRLFYCLQGLVYEISRMNSELFNTFINRQFISKARWWTERLNPGQGLELRSAHLRSTATKLSTARSWEGTTLALASSKGFLLALTRESTGTALTVEQLEYREVKVTPATVATTGGGVATTPAAVMCPTPAAENRKYLTRAATWTYLVASCTDKAYALIERCKGDPYMAWSILQEKYCATDAAELWFNDLDHLNMRLARINLKYQKEELQRKRAT